MTTPAARALAALGESEAVLLKGISLPRSGSAKLVGSRSPTATDAPREPTVTADGEPIYDLAARQDIQGNIIPGFNKNHQQFLFLRFADVAGAKQWLRWLAPRLATMDEVLAFRRAFRAERLRLGVREPAMTATWNAIAFSHRGIAVLAGPEQANQFGEQSFRQGLAERSTYLGDPADPAALGHRDNWVIGGPGNEADALLIIDADDEADLIAEVDEIVGRATDHGIQVVFSQRGDNLPGNLQGHEHFGFKDGISQPGIRGAVSAAPGDRLTPRYLAETDPHARLFAKPGQPLVWPGEFLLGEPRQDPRNPYLSAPPAGNFPSWARRGSYLVCRRLRQDVIAFWEFAATVAAQLGVSAVHAAAMLVGRWPSGAPLSRSSGQDNLVLAGDEFASNHFLFDDDTRPSVMAPIPGYEGDNHPAARQDIFGTVCPHAAHIRKVNPRDSATDFGAPADTLLRLMLRRGIPFGPPIAGVPAPSPGLVAQERGLLFVAYASTIEDQFEFVTRRWANSAVQPNLGGEDPIIGQRERYGSRDRSIELPTADGGTTAIALRQEFVTPTGGGYFFAPPISAVAGILAGR
jgi:Dyp-type peroxidase family